MSVSINADDGNARNCRGAEPGPIRLGSEQHKVLFSRMLLDTHNPYKPAVIDWPRLDAASRERLVNLPIWDIAVQTEGKASLNVKSYAATVADPLLKQAMDLNGFEEARAQDRAFEPGRGLWNQARARARLCRPVRPRMGVHGDRLKRVHRQLLRFWPVRVGTTFGLLPAGVG